MSRAVVSLRLNQHELRFVDQLAADKGITRAAALHQIFLQQVALSEIEKSVARVVETQLAELRQAITDLQDGVNKTVRIDDMVKVTQHITSHITNTSNTNRGGQK